MAPLSETQTVDDSASSKVGFFRPFRRFAPEIHLPLLQEIPRYTREKFKADAFAGLTLAFVAIPQAIAFALILEVPPSMMLLSAVIGGVVGALFFSSHHHVFGPTSSATLMAAAIVTTLGASGVAHDRASLLAWLALLVGAMQLLAGVLHFGEVTKFISRSVIIAYSAAIGLMLIASQLRYFFIISDTTANGFFAQSLADTLMAVSTGKIAWGDLGVGLLTLVIFRVVHRWLPRWPEALVGLIVLGLAAWALTSQGLLSANQDAVLPVRLLGDIAGMRMADGMAVSWLNFPDSALDLLPLMLGGTLAIAIVGMLESSAITRTLAAKSGQGDVNANQELCGMGAGNVVSALFGAPPGASSFTRSAVNYESGARTQFSAVFGNAAVLAVLLFLTPFFQNVPLAALAVLLIRVGWRMINFKKIRVACRSTRSDAAVFIVTLAFALFVRLDIAIYVGIGFSLALFLQKTSSPILVEYTFDESGSLEQLSEENERANPQVAIIHVEGELFFGAADVFFTQIRHQADTEKIRIFILRLKNARHLDASTIMALETLHEHLSKNGRHLLISGCSEDVLRVLRNSGIIKVLGTENIFASVPNNHNFSTKKALLRATQILGTDMADIRIFYDKRREKKNAPIVEYTPNYQI